jgi:hypothetical protein
MCAQRVGTFVLQGRPQHWASEFGFWEAHGKQRAELRWRWPIPSRLRKNPLARWVVDARFRSAFGVVVFVRRSGSRVRCDHPLWPIREIVNGALSALSADFALLMRGSDQHSGSLFSYVDLGAACGVIIRCGRSGNCERGAVGFERGLRGDLCGLLRHPLASARSWSGWNTTSCSAGSWGWELTTHRGIRRPSARTVTGCKRAMLARKFFAAVLAHPRVKRLLSTDLVPDQAPGATSHSREP